MALGNAYQCRIIVYECTETNTWTNDLRNNKAQYDKVLYFAKTELSHLDLVVDSKKIGNPDLFTESSDSEIQITKVIPANEQNNNRSTSTQIEIKEENISENYTSNTRTLSETKRDVRRRASGEIYISEHY